MKKIVFFFTCATLLFSGCAKVQNEEVVPETGKRTATLNASIDNSDTRVGITINGSTATYSWQQSDKILVSTIFTNELGSINGMVEGSIRSGSISSDGGRASFDVVLEEGCTLGKYAFYPDDWLCWADGDDILFGLSDYYPYQEGVSNMPMLGTITSTGATFRAVGGLLMVQIDNIPISAQLLHFSVEGKKIAGSFPVIGSGSNRHIEVEDFGENWQEMDSNSIDIRFDWDNEEGGDPEGGEGEIIGLRAPMTFYIPLPCGKYNNLSFSICGRTADTPLFTRIARMDNNGDGIFSDDEGIEIGRNEVVVAPPLTFQWDSNPPKTISLDVVQYQYEESLDENGVLNVEQFDNEIDLKATIKGKYSSPLEDFDPNLISCKLVNVTDPENIVETPVSFSYAENYDFVNFSGSEAVLNVSIPTNTDGKFKLKVSYGTLTPAESFVVEVWKAVPLPEALSAANWDVYAYSRWFNDYRRKNNQDPNDQTTYLKTYAASLRTELPANAFRGSFNRSNLQDSFSAFAYFKNITSIPNDAFNGCAYMEDICLPSNITSIGSNAFYNCDALTTINLPEGITSIGNNAFYNCKALTTISLPDGLTSIGNGAFESCTELSSIQLPDGVTSIGANTFKSCEHLASINLDNLVFIGQKAFYGCNGLETLVIGNASIGADAFLECANLQSVTIGDNSSGGQATIGNQAFGSCESLSQVTLNSVSSIGHRAFSWCSLGSITLSDNLTLIGNEAFWGSNLQTITIPNSVSSIGDGSFSYCYNLTFVEFERLSPPAILRFDEYDSSASPENADIINCFYFGDGPVPNYTIYVPADAFSTYQTTWSSVADRIQAKPADL